MSTYAIIMIGGKGSRLWPLSTSEKPKQFCNIMGDLSIFQETINRLKNVRIITLCSKKYIKYVRSQMREIGRNDYEMIEEPYVRGTGPAIAYACNMLYSRDRNAKIITLPSDHHIKDVSKFQKMIRRGINNLNDKIVCFGVEPIRPNTGFGYIETSKRLKRKVYEVESFKEKPNLENAEKYMMDGKHFWNCGIYAFNISTIIHLFQKHTRIIDDVLTDYESTQTISFENSLLEECDDIICVYSNMQWNDIGTWAELWRESSRDENGNNSDRKVYSNACKNCYFKSDAQLDVYGITNSVIVVKGDIIMMCSLGSSQDVKELNDNKRVIHSYNVINNTNYNLYTIGMFNIRIEHTNILRISKLTSFY